MSAVQRLAKSLEWPVAILALLVIPALVLEERALTPGLRTAGIVLNWVIWVAFCVDFGVRWAASGSRSFPARAWLDLLLIAATPPFGVPAEMQGMRSIRVLRLLRLVRAFGLATMALRMVQRHMGRQKFHYVALLALAVVLMGAIAVYVVEVGRNETIVGFGDALWWAAATVTTVGYGDVTPITAEGRFVAVVLMVTGIGVIGVFTATVASFLFSQEQEPGASSIEARLDAMERKLDELLRHAREPASRD